MGRFTSSCRRRPTRGAVGALGAAGARVISLTPCATTLEELFVRAGRSATAASAREGRPAVSLPTVGRVALHVFRESVRDKVLYSLVGFAVLLIGASLLIGQLTAGQDVKIIKDLGLAAMSLFGSSSPSSSASGSCRRSRAAQHLHRARQAVRRRSSSLGKYAGLVLTLAVNLAVMAAAFYLVLAYMARVLPTALVAAPAPAVDPMLLVAIGMILRASWRS
jgi:hypothetical protein